jgi:hypothetical protein
LYARNDSGARIGEMARRLGIDIGIDLERHSIAVRAHSISAHWAVPVQVSYSRLPDQPHCSVVRD